MKDTIYSREQYLRKRAAEKEALNIQLTNNYAFRKLFKMNYIARGFLIALLGLDEEDVVKLEIIDPFEEGENEEEMAVSDEVSRMRTARNEGIQLAKKVFKLFQKGYTEAQIAEECNIEEYEVKEILE